MESNTYPSKTDSKIFLLSLSKIIATILLLIIVFLIGLALPYLSIIWYQKSIGEREVIPEAEIKIPKELPSVKGYSSDVLINQGCVVGGCSGELCVDFSEKEKVFSTCILKPEYVCYQKAVCERQPDGKCSFTETPEFKSCISEFRLD